MSGPFASLRTQPRWLPLLLLTMLTVFVTNALVISRIGLAEITRTAMDGDPRTDELVAQLEKSTAPHVLMYAAPPFLAAVSLFAIAGCFLLILYVLHSEVHPRPVLAVVMYSFLVYSLATGVLTVALATFQTESFNPHDPLISSVADFFDEDRTNPFVYELLESLDVFSALCLMLIAHGFSVVVPNLRYSTAWLIVAGAWVPYVIIRAGLLATVFR